MAEKVASSGPDLRFVRSYLRANVMFTYSEQNIEKADVLMHVFICKIKKNVTLPAQNVGFYRVFYTSLSWLR